jgi:hypothetical protein
MYRDVRIQDRAAMYRDVQVQARAGARLGRARCAFGPRVTYRDAATLGHPGLRGISTSCTSQIQDRAFGPREAHSNLQLRRKFNGAGVRG